MSTADLSMIQSSSMFPGLQNIGSSDTTLTINGPIANQANLIGNSRIFFPKQCMAVIRVNLPDAPGDLSAKWFPVIGTVQLYNATAGSSWYLTLYTLPDPNGRSVFFDFISNELVNTTTLTNFRIHLYAHLYTYPF